jgi:acyl-coenzyme A synthetase/AMP-(fatty) acid ligase
MDVFEGLEKHANNILAIGDTGQEWSYSDLLELSATLARQDVRRRLVFCLCNNDAGALLGYLALRHADAVPVLLNANLQASQLSALARAYKPAFLWAPSQCKSALDAVHTVVSFQQYELLPWHAERSYPIHADLALLLSTSGSTGSPKLVRQSHLNLNSNAQAIAHYLGLTSEDRPITTLPMSYTYGLSVIHSHVLHGCTIALTARSFFDRSFWEFLKSARATSFGGVPYHYDMLKKLRFFNMQLPSLQTLTQAGGRMDPGLALEVAQACAARGIRYFAMYGQAEATARMSYLPPEKAISKAGSIGQAIPGGAFWLENDSGQRINSPDEVGQLVYQGPNVTMGYAQNHADLAHDDDNLGVLRTGDLARRDAEGDYYIVGRQKRFLKLFGHRVNLQDVDDALHEDGHDAACGGQDDHLRLYIASFDPAQAAAIKQRVATMLKVHPGAVSVIGVEALPRNEVGKIQFAALDSLPEKVLA